MSIGRFFLAVAGIALCCGMVKDCADEDRSSVDYERYVDTLVYVDTVRYYELIPKDSAVVRYVTIRVPQAAMPETEVVSPCDKPAASMGEEGVSPCDKPAAAMGEEGVSPYDKPAASMGEEGGIGLGGHLGAVEEEGGVQIDSIRLAVISRHYGDSCYDAWVSGPVDPRLDSIRVYGRREEVRVWERVSSLRSDHNGGRGRWGIGFFAGYGVTPRGMQPCAGISVNYNLWRF